MSCVQRVKTTIESLSVAYGPTWQGETCLRQVGKDERTAGMDKWRCTERGISKNNKQTVCATGRRHFGKATQNRDLNLPANGRETYPWMKKKNRDLNLPAIGRETYPWMRSQPSSHRRRRGSRAWRETVGGAEPERGGVGVHRGAEPEGVRVCGCVCVGVKCQSGGRLGGNG